MKWDVFCLGGMALAIVAGLWFSLAPVAAQSEPLPAVQRFDWAGAGVTPEMQAAFTTDPEAGAFAYLEARGDSLGLRDSDPQFFVALDTIRAWAQR